MSASNTESKVLIIVGDASETVDTLYPYYRLQEDGFIPVVAAPEKRRYQMVMHEVKPGWTITKEWEGYTIEAAVAFRDVDPADYLGIMFSGGRAPEYIRYDPDLVRITRHFSRRTSRSPAYATAWKSRRTPDASRDAEWRPSPNASSI
jgi:protease I